MGKGTVRKPEDLYSSEFFSVHNALLQYNYLKNLTELSFDASALSTVLDLESALSTAVYTPVERQLLALLYFARPSLWQAAQLVGVKTHEINDIIEEATEKVSAVLMGYRTEKLAPVKRDDYGTIEEWLEEVGQGTAPIYFVPDVFLKWCAEQGDQKAQETLRQREEGAPEFEEETYEPQLYTNDMLHLLDRQLDTRYEDLSNRFEGGTVVGRKSSFGFEEAQPYSGSSRIYKR